MRRNRRPQIPDSGNRRIMRSPVAQPVDAGTYNGLGSIEVGLTDFQMNDMPTLTFQFVGPSQHLERSFAPNPLHSFGCSAFCIQLHPVTSPSVEMTSKYNIVRI